MVEYFAMSLNNIHMVDEYTKNILWRGMEYALKKNSHACLLVLLSWWLMVSGGELKICI